VSSQVYDVAFSQPKSAENGKADAPEETEEEEEGGDEKGKHAHAVE